MAESPMGKERSRLRSKARRHRYRILRVREKLRITSNVGLVVGQCILLFLSRDWGLRVVIVSSFLSFPYFLHEKMWDVVVLVVFMNIVNLVGLFVQ